MYRILHIIDSLSVGGAEKLLVRTINGLPDYEHHVMVLKDPVPLQKEITVSHKFINLECTSFRDIFSKFKTARKYIKEHRINLVHSHLYEANLLARLAVPRSVSLINTIHAISSLASYKINRISLYLERLSYKKRHVIIAVSKAVLDDFDKWVGLKGKNFVLYNFIEDRFFLQPGLRKEPVDALKLVAVGNLRWQKNYPYLLEAFRKMPPNVHLDIYGEGSLRAQFQEEIDRHQLNIRLLGLRDDLENVLPGYDAFIMSSFYEGQPLSLLEAVACGLPAILADIPVLKEVLEESALYFDLKNTDTVVNRVNEILAGKHDLNQLMHDAQRKISQFARKQQYLEKLTGIYNDVVN